MEYIAILKDGGLFIPNVLADLEDSHSAVFKIPLDLQSLREQAKSKALLQENVVDNESKKVNLADIPISAFENIEDPVEWQNSQRHSEDITNQVEQPVLSIETSKQAKILSFAGSWQELDKNILSTDSIEKRRLESLKERNT